MNMVMDAPGDEPETETTRLNNRVYVWIRDQNKQPGTRFIPTEVSKAVFKSEESRHVEIVTQTFMTMAAYGYGRMTRRNLAGRRAEFIQLYRLTAENLRRLQDHHVVDAPGATLTTQWMIDEMLRILSVAEHLPPAQPNLSEVANVVLKDELMRRIADGKVKLS